MLVMNASKFPRLGDGYYERNKTHYEDKYPSKADGYMDRYMDRGGRESPGVGSGRRGASRERYANKQSYMDRARDRLQKGTSSSPADRRLNHNSSSGGGGHGHAPERRPSVNDKKLSAGGGGGGKSAAGRKDKPDIQKSALRICGDWSEHLSSKGKKYYYNIHSEDSKWEKPKEWHESKARFTEYGMAKEKERQNGREQSRHHASSNKHDERHRATHSGSGSGAPPSSMEKRDSQQRLAKSFSTPIGAPVTSRHNTPMGGPPPTRHNSTYSKDAPSRTSSNADSRTSKGYDARGRDGREDRRRDDPWSQGGRPSSGREDWGSAGERRPSAREDGYDRPRRGERSHPPPHHSHGPGPDRRNSLTNSTGSGHHCDNTSNGPRAAADPYRNENEDSRHSEDMDISPGSTPSNQPASRQSSRVGTPITSTPGASSTTKGGGATSRGGHGPGHTERSPGGKQDGQNLTQTALQQLQILQRVLMVQQEIKKQQKQKQQQPPPSSVASQQPPSQQHHHSSSSHHHPPVTSNSGGGGSNNSSQQHHHHHHSQHHHRQQHLNTSGDGGDMSPVSEGTPTYEPQHLPPWESAGGILNLPGSGAGAAGGGTGEPPGHNKHSPRSDTSHRSRNSPCRSEDGTGHPGGGGPVTGAPPPVTGTSALAAATSKKQPGVLTLTPSLANYYKERLVEHVQGWPSDAVEKQAIQYAEEGHLVGSQHCTQVSVDLKRARSLVRIAEIQSTLQEQRVLFLKQQIADLERSQNTYMPPSSSSDTT